VLLVSSDAPLANEMHVRLDREFAARVVCRETILASGAGDIGSNVDAIFYDLRSDAVEADFRFLHAQPKRPPVFAFGDQAYGLSWAALSEQVISGRLRLPLEADQVREALSAGRNSQCGPTGPWGMPKVIKGTTVSFTTYMPEMFPMLDRVQSLAGHDVTMLLVGETGSGKTTLARLVHELSPRRWGPFVTVACGALPPDLIESELFGHVRGAFTGADHTKIGRFETAERGTFLLDEIDLLGPKEQSKLLRVIETGEYEAVGSSETKHTDVRLIVCANVDLNQMMARQRFRADLYYRLNVLEFIVPPLRKRVHDIVPLAVEFIEEFSANHGIKIARIHTDFLEALRRYQWPGNIRELKNHMRRAVLFATGDQLTPHDLSAVILQDNGSVTSAGGWKAEGRPGNLANQVARTERDLLAEALAAHGYKRSATARALGISRVGLYKKLKKYGMVDYKRETNGQGVVRQQSES